MVDEKMYVDGYTEETLDQSLDMLEKQAKREKQTQPQVSTSTTLPDIILHAQDDVIAEQVLAAIEAQEKVKPTHFLYGGALVRIGEKKVIRNGVATTQPFIVPIDEAQMISTMKDAANFYTTKSKKKASHPPAAIARLILTWLTKPEKQHLLPFPVLSVIVEAPTLRIDGGVIDTPGYDTQTGVYYYAHKNAIVPTIVENPTDVDIHEAKRIIDEAICDFPFESSADYAGMYALLLTPFVREAIHGSVLVALLDAPKPRTGKGLIADVVCTIATGQPAVMDDLPTNDTDLKKLIDSIVSEGRSFIIFDNTIDIVDSKNLARAVTAKIYSGRILGTSTTIKKPLVVTWIITGNNIRTSGEMTLRCYRVRLNRRMSNPEKYNNFTHNPLLPWIEEKRMELMSALLTLARAYYARGKPKNDALPHIGGFEEFIDTVGGILHIAGIEGWLSNVAIMADESDAESGQIESFLIALHRYHKNALKSARELVDTFDDAYPGTNDTIRECVPDKLRKDMEKAKNVATVLTNYLEKQRDSYFGEDEYRIVSDKDKHTKKKMFHIERKAITPPPSTDLDEEGAKELLFAYSAYTHDIESSNEKNKNASTEYNGMHVRVEKNENRFENGVKADTQNTQYPQSDENPKHRINLDFPEDEEDE